MIKETLQYMAVYGGIGGFCWYVWYLGVNLR